MPGITGLIGARHPEECASALHQMVNCMMHEPSYTSGTYAHEQLSLWIGWTAHKDSFSDCMPVWNETKDVCLIFSGEDFTDSGEIEALKTRGHRFAAGNANYLVHLYEEMGLKFMERLNGYFGGMLVDLREQKAVLFNDRYGLGRIYYHENEDGVYFSSEAKALLKVLPELRQLDSRSLAETFSCGCVLQNRTLFRGISLLPGGSLWTFAQKHNVGKENYFDRSVWENQPLLSGAEYYEKLKDTFCRALPRYLRGPGRVAMSLTGGLDGRLIMAWANPSPGELPCYTFGGTYRDCADVRIAREIAQVCRQSHKTIAVDRDFFTEFPKLAEKAVFISDGTMDVTGSVELYVNRFASRIAPVRLTGNYGSEIVRGNVAFRTGSLREELLEPEFAELVRDVSTTYGSEYEGHRQSFIAFKQVPWHHYSRLSVEQSQLMLRSPYLDNDLVSLTYQASPELILSKDLSLRLIAEGGADLARIPTDRGVLYRPNPLIGNIRHRYQEFTAKSEYAYDYGMPQWLAEIDHVLAPLHLERLFLGRHKFYHFRVWYRDKLSRCVKDILLDPSARNRPYLRGTFLDDMVNSHVKGSRNYTLEIHRVLTTELIQRQLIEQ
jgi:asparagine synthase (glutamine-hydrolysing)